MKKMGKKGQGLPLTTIIIAILVVVVLIVIVAFFLGGTASITDTIKRVFFGTTAGYDLNLAIQTCQSRCEAAKELPATARTGHAYCQSGLAVDRNPIDGEADYVEIEKKKRTVKYYCPPVDDYRSLPLGGAYSGPASKSNIGFLDIGCDLGTDFKCELPTDWPTAGPSIPGQ